jgi:hypothetical protein
LRKNILTLRIGNDPEALFEALNKCGLLTATNQYYTDDMLMNDPVSGRGPYELAKEAIEQLKREKKL